MEIVEMPDQGLNAGRYVKRFEHMAAHKVSEIPHRFHRDSLMKQLQRLVILDSETTPEPTSVRRKSIKYLTTQATQLFAKLRDIRAEVREVGRNCKLTIRTDEIARRLPVLFFHPEDLGQAYRLAIAGVMKDTEDDGITVLVAQRNRPGRTRDLVTLRFVVPEHIGAQRPLLAVG